MRIINDEAMENGERERKREGKEEDRATKSCYPGRQGATKALIWVTLSLLFHDPERSLTETPTIRSCSPLRRNKAAGVKQRTSHLHTFRM